MSEVLERVVTTREAAHEVAKQVYAHAQTLLLNGEPVRITCGEDQDDLTIKQRRFFHGPVLSQISEQVRVAGERYVMSAWKEYYRREFLGHRYEMQKLPGQKRATPRKIRISTEDLGIKDYSNYIDRVIAHAASEFGVEFRFILDEREAVRYVRKAKKGSMADAYYG